MGKNCKLDTIRRMTANLNLILASTSRYRREVLERLGYPFTTKASSVDETPLEGETPEQLALRLAIAKARAVAKDNPGCVVIGSDQVCALGNKALGKPHNYEGAVRQLTDMQGNTLVFHTAVCVIGADGSEQTCVSDTRIEMRALSAKAIAAYVRREEPYDCAGSAKIEKLGIALMKSVSSDDPTSLIGLPLMRVTDMLLETGIEVIDGLGE